MQLSAIPVTALSFFNIKKTYSKKPDEFSSPVDTKITCDHLKDLLNQGYKIAYINKVGHLFIKKHGVFKAWLEPEQITSTSTNAASSPPLDLAVDDLDTEDDSETEGILDEFQVMEEEMDTVEQQDSEFEASCTESENYESD